MKRLLIAGLVIVAAFLAFKRLTRHEVLEPLQPLPYVVVYGRNSCGDTQRMEQGLREAGVTFTSASVDDGPTAHQLHQRMERAGFDTSSYGLPVVDVNGQLSVRPDLEDVVSTWRGH